MDFGADVPFHAVPNKLQEHYGFEICQEVIRQTVLKHAKKAGDLIEKAEEMPDSKGIKQLIAEADGGMVPIVTVDRTAKDKRKTRELSWKEARLCFSRDVDKVKAHFRATLKSIDETGDLWFGSALAAGLGTTTQVHCIGDGAVWIKDQVDRIFANQGSYLIDFYHVSEYLSAASVICNPTAPIQWRTEQQNHLKEGRLYLTLQALEKHLDNDCGEGKPVISCYRYLTNRLHQLDYLGAIMCDLPIGSGEIESAHRHVVQKRLKRAGSWWKEENAESMLQLLTLRVNEKWNEYWDQQRVGFTEEAA